MVTKEIIIRNEQGFHVRPAQLFVDKANEFRSDLKVRSESGEEADGKSMLDLMTLGLEKGARVTLEVSGPDEQECLQALAELIESKFGES
ncbi:HPr family phosphocarrier protein [Paenibacillus tyrfis]|uniref:HPr family phosphocarrier protein n=1 Tax=Paenibacillus tyrfis TaxID=1501230 RepID=UPI00209CB54D|nr:HPr family phosphocarrier protein [Paenibacillus tyrfis]MCP1310744.1 HPr family phosphocarrier protein [Paenibacillus tyrfis]